ncbi:MAG: TraR/DksA C4-type zinc finger protein [Thermaerobacter sp.]|nr:TraR/DksA C4-type zinc finger protein [Thermaerobacter sp.]
MEIEGRLQARRQELVGLIDELRDSGLGMPMTEAVGELSSYDNHSSDLAEETFEREKDLGLLGNLKAQLQRVDAAKQRLREGTYGICQRCGKKIPRERLDALPWAEYCRDCQAAVAPEDTARPPLEQELLEEQGMFRHSFRDGTDEVGYDGEDTWQELAMVGNANSPQDVPPAVRVDQAYVDSDELHGAVEAIENQVDEEGGFLGEADQEVDPGS